ncbi:MAG: porin [Poseidonibacter sp.]|uniref:porin n=1 Tax=Poseidonibacter sp. TaxID=2321188 RepID=UPI00359E970D
MKKIAKLSLVAAVAVAGLSTSLSAKALEEAIKNVDVSGTVVYRYDDRTQENDTVLGSNNESNNSYKIAVNLKSKINDDLTANTRTVIGAGTTDMAAVGGSTKASDGEAAFALTQANFAYTGLANTTIIAGKQAVPSPFAVQADAAGNEDTGTGITAVYNAGIVTVAGTYLNQTNLEAIEGQDVAGLGLMANAGPVALDAWYLNVKEGAATGAANSEHAAYTIGAKAKIDVVSLYARYSAISHDFANQDTESLWKVGAKAKLGMVGFGVDYGQTNDVDSVLTGASLTGDADAATSMQGWGLNLEKKDDASLLKLNVNADVMSGINLSANYNTLKVDSATDEDATEYYGQLTHKMGKNFMYYVRIGQVDVDNNTDDKGTRGRLHVQYSF